MNILHITITNINLDNTSYDEGNSDTIIHVSKTWVGMLSLQNAKHLKKDQ